MLDKIKEIIANQLYIDVSEVKDDSNFVTDLHADSLDVVQMLIEMENQFGIRFDDEELQQIKTVEDASNLINKKI